MDNEFSRSFWIHFTETHDPIEGTFFFNNLIDPVVSIPHTIYGWDPEKTSIWTWIDFPEPGISLAFEFGVEEFPFPVFGE